MIEIELFDGTIIELPEGTSPEVIQRVVQDGTARRRAAMADAAQTPTDAPAGAPAPGTDVPAAQSGVPTPTEALGDTTATSDFQLDAEGRPILFGGRPSALDPAAASFQARPRTPEQAMPGLFGAQAGAEGMPAFDPARQVPPGMVAEYDNIRMFPQSGVWADINPQAEAERIAVQEQALARRDLRSREPGIQGMAYRNVSSVPELSGFLSGATYGLQDEAGELLDPVAGEAMRQEYNQASAEHPWRTVGGELLGGVANVLLTRRIPGVARIQDAAVSAPLSRSLPYGVGAGVLAGGGYRATTNQPGERMEGVFDPASIAIDAALGGAVPIGGAAVRGVRQLRGGTPAPISELGDALGAYTGTSGPYGVPEYQRLADEQAVRDYIASVSPTVEGAERVALGEAAQHLGVDIPRGIVDNPDAYARAARERGLFSRGPLQRAEDRMNQQLSDRFGQAVTAGGQVPTPPGVAGDRLRTSIMQNLDQQISQLRRQYDEFAAQMPGEFELPANVGETLDQVFKRRFEAGAESDADTAFIGEVANLVRRGGGTEGEELVGGVTWQGIRDARTMLKTQTANFSRGQQLTPKQRDMITMEQSLTEAIEDVIRKNAPEGQAEAMVQQFKDLDYQYAIAQETRREMDDLFSGGSTSVMNTLGKALRDGGQSSIDLVNNLKRNSSPDDWENARAVLLHQLGSDDLGQLDVTKFGEAWTKIAPDVRDVVFDRGHISDLNAIARIGRRLPAIRQGGAQAQMPSIGSLFRPAAAGALGSVAAGPLGGVAAAAGALVARVVNARRLTNPYTAKQASKLYKNLDDIAKAQSDAARSLGLLRLNREIDAYSTNTGTPLPPGTNIPTNGASARRPGQQNVVGTVGD